MRRLPLTIDLTNIITKVTGEKITRVFNDKRKDFKRRYKFCDIHNVTPANIKKIRTAIEKKYPECQFVVKNAECDSRNKTNYYDRLSYYNGLKVFVF